MVLTYLHFRILEISHWFMSVKTAGLPYSIYNKGCGESPTWGLGTYKLQTSTSLAHKATSPLASVVQIPDASHQAGYGPTPSDKSPDSWLIPGWTTPAIAP